MNTDEPDDGAGEVADRPAAQIRDTAAEQRDVDGQLRDTAGDLRDTAAGRRDRQAASRDSRTSPPTGHGSTPRGEASASSGADSESDRTAAAGDRTAAAGDRAAAASDRTHASANRSASAQDRHNASLDRLTGVLNREAGLFELDRELADVRRTGRPLVLAFVDVDQLKRLNDNHGHGAGDQMLTAVALTLRAVLRSHDLVFRYGGDEFLCVVGDVDITAAGARFDRINDLLAAVPGRGSVTIGLAQLRPDDTSQSLIARADAQLYEQRRR